MDAHQKKKIEELERLVENMKLEDVNNKKKVEGLEQQVVTLTEKLKIPTPDPDTLRSLDECRQTLAASMKENIEFRSEIARLTELNSASAASLANLNELKNLLTVSQASEFSLMKENSDLKADVARLNDHNNTLTAVQNELKGLLTISQASELTLISELGELRNEVAAFAIEKKKYNELAEVHESLRKDLKAVTDEMEIFIRKNISLEADIVRLTAIAQNVEEMKMQLEAERDARRNAENLLRMIQEEIGPKAPTKLTAVSNFRDIKLTWEDSFASSYGPVSYVVFQAAQTTFDSSTQSQYVEAGRSTTNSIIISAYNCSDPYVAFRVCGYDRRGKWGVFSDPYTVELAKVNYLIHH